MSKQATTTRTTKGFDGFSLLGRVVVRAPWLVITAWIALVLVLFVIGLTNDIDRLSGEGFNVR